MADTLKPSQAAALWGISDRGARYVLSELEALGAELQTDYYGARLLPERLANGVAAARKAGQPLETLLNEPELKRYFRREADPLAELVELRAECAIMREMMGALWGSLQKGVSRPPTDISWGYLALPDPRGKL